MDLSLATDTYSSTYLHQHHHHHLQQQDQQQQQQNLNHHQHLPHQQHQYQYHHSQLPQALSLAPPSGKGLFDLESLEHTGASSSSGLGQLGASSFQPEYGLSSYTSGAPNPSSSSASALPSHHLMPSHSPGQLWGRSPMNTHSPHVGAGQNLNYSSARAAATTAHDLHFAGYNGGSHSLSDGRTAQISSTQGWAVSEPHHSQWSQRIWDNCLPPGVEPSATSAPNATLSHMHTHLQGHAVSHPHFHPQSTLDLQMYRQLQQHKSLATNVRTGKPPQKLVPKRKSAKAAAETKIPVVKTIVMKETGAAKGLAPEKGPGWCFVCQRNCVTEVALRQHLEGKGHRKQVERQKLRAEVASKIAEEDGGVSNMLEQVWVQVSMMGKPARAGKSKKKPKVEEARKDAQPTDVKPNAEGEPTATKKKVVEMVRCELCNVECNSQTVLEFHFGGKKHAARLKKSQESAVACTTEQTVATTEQPALTSTEQPAATCQ
ncbi:hypothetical protein GOP47_0012043 [Adiantum capillus-veneris]|uniref:U1-type domain-containing protein n=1 Tax=Adiantum capillus-veneris TaxID=13818 RepID=A0A9D4UUL6_ADICA|nr:hypothetical protein GOP47_0012043 [Adiantum capillus-veneris]